MRFTLALDIEIQDDALADNYFTFSTSSCVNSSNADGVMSASSFNPGAINYKAEPIFGEHVGIFEEMMGASSEGFTFFTDRQFNGKSYTLHLLFDNASYHIHTNNPIDDYFDYNMVVRLSSVSQSYYNWASYVWYVNESSVSDYTALGFGDPIWGYSNVSTRAGVLAAETTIDIEFNLKDFIKTSLNATAI